MSAILKPDDPLAVAAVHGFTIFIVVSIFADARFDRYYAIRHNVNLDIYH